jgi:stearoyl-CoA desaturase (delta-9 desaturase)
MGDLTALLWGGAARIFRCTTRRSASSRCATSSASRTTTAPTSHATSRGSRFPPGEAWHNSYRAFPTSSRHGADGRQIDLSAQFIELMEKLGIAYDVVRVGAARRARKTLKAVS